MKKIIAIITICMMMLGAVGITKNAPVADANEVVAYQVAQDGDVQITYEDGTSVMTTTEKLYDKFVEYGEVQEDGDWVLYLVDGSTVLINQEKKEFLLYTKELGDWYTSFDTYEHLLMGIQTYINYQLGI